MMNKTQFQQHLRNYLKKNSLFPDGEKEVSTANFYNSAEFTLSIDRMDFTNASKLAPWIVDHLKQAGATSAVVVDKNDPRKKFCDVHFQRKGKTGCILIGGDALNANYKRGQASNNGIEHFFHINNKQSFINCLIGSRFDENPLFR